MQRYEKYKDSGIDWLGEIPEHWEVKKITHLFKKIGSGTTPTAGSALYYDNGIINFLQTGDLNNNYIFSTSKKITERALLDYSSLKIFPVGSLVIAMYGATIGKLGILKIEATTNQACCVLGECQIELDLKYIFYWFIFAKNQILSMSYGGGQPNISQDLIKSLRVHFPTFHEQKSIAKFLDDKCKRIDAAVDLKEQQIEKLKELHEIIIHNAVTKGVPHSEVEAVQMKYSGIDWIGEIPEHWDIMPIKYFTYMQSGETISAENFVEEGYPVFGGNGFRGYAKRYTNEGKTVLIGRQGALCGNVNYADGKFFASEHAIVVYPTRKVNLKWLGEIIRLADFNRLSQSAAQPGIAVNVIKNVLFPFPSYKEQCIIGAYLDKQTTKIDKAIAQKQEQIVKLKEYKQSLINEVVTGKIKVSI
ncbi:restriction endonuclease subunit S [Sphingobacterium multivorum]|uniref:restriction endonuclease subunit S n=1 Tax=Sphingobacterium multivorum TaxID=28454 RepID=UPI003DA3A9E6